jgi:hypothetical protein
VRERIALVVVAWLAIVAIGGFIVACGGEAVEEPTAVVQPSSPPTDVPPTETARPPSPTETELPEPTSPPEPTALPSAENCITCHTDEKVLQAMAVDEEVKSEASSGEG